MLSNTAWTGLGSLRLLWAGLAVLVVCASACSQQKDVDFAGTVVTEPYEVASVDLITTDGQTLDLARDTTVPLTLLFFGYTSCPDICPAVLGSLAAGLLKLDDNERSQIEVVFVTTDPERDTSSRLDRYLDRFDPTFVGATGDIDLVSDLGVSVGVYVDEGEPLEDGGYDPNSHGTYVVAIDTSGHAPAVWGRETSPSEFANDIRFMITEFVD